MKLVISDSSTDCRSSPTPSPHPQNLISIHQTYTTDRSTPVQFIVSQNWTSADHVDYQHNHRLTNLICLQDLQQMQRITSPSTCRILQTPTVPPRMLPNIHTTETKPSSLKSSRYLLHKNESSSQKSQSKTQ